MHFQLPNASSFFSSIFFLSSLLHGWSWVQWIDPNRKRVSLVNPTRPASGAGWGYWTLFKNGSGSGSAPNPEPHSQPDPFWPDPTRLPPLRLGRHQIVVEGDLLWLFGGCRACVKPLVHLLMWWKNWDIYIYIFFDNGRIEMYISKDIDISFAREGVGCHDLTRIDLFVSKFHWCFVSLFLCFGCFSN